jgi:HK97 family phage major capsid protein
MVGGKCTECDYVEPDPAKPAKPDDPPAQPATAKGGAPPLVVPSPAPPTPGPQARSHTMTAEELAAERAALVAAETTRQNEIRALCAEHNIDDATRDKWLASSSVTPEAVSHQIMRIGRERRAADPSISLGADRAAQKPFATLGEQLVAIAAHGMGKADALTIGRLHAAASGASANVGADGGFLIQKEFSTELLESTIEQGSLLGEADTHEVGANADGLEVVYLDETSRATGSRWGGVQVYRAAEAEAATAKRPKLGKWEVRLEDIIGAAYITERLLQDAASIQNVFSSGFMAEFQFVAEDEMVRGNGVGQMLGILNAGVTVSVAKETGQGADTVVAENIGRMWKSVHPRSRLKGNWYYNVELEPQFDQLQIGTGTSGQLVYMPPGGISEAPYARIKGRPVIPIEYASGAGDVGDFFFADWSRYKIITKGGLQSDESIHVRFLNNERTFRWITRINGAPKDKAAITPYKATDSTFKLSPFVTLAAR